MPKFIPLSTLKDTTFDEYIVSLYGDNCSEISLEVYNNCKERALVALKNK